MSEPKSTREARFDQALEEYQAAADAGRRIEPAELAARYPDIASDLEEYFSNRDYNAREAASARLTQRGLPQRFAHYELQQRIGRGGMGVVYKAYDPKAKRSVALKTIDRPFAESLDLERFRREAVTAANTKHPNIVAVYEVAEYEGQPYYTMMLVEGPNLQAVATTFTGRPRAAAELLITVAEAIHHAHDADIIHRDLKPSNILLDPSGRPFIADFGVAKKVGAEALTGTGEVLGTIEYMAPEQAVGEHAKVGACSDVYSLGAIFYVLLTGRLPISGSTPAETARLLQTTDPAPPCTPDGKPVDRDLAAICLQCLEKEPRDRYRNALELAADLARWLRDDRIHARHASRLRAIARAVRRHRVRAVAGLLLLLLGVYFWSDREDRREQILASNLYSARNVGGQFLDRMRRWGDRVVAVAGDDDLRRLLAASSAQAVRSVGELRMLPEVTALQTLAERLHGERDRAIENWNVLDDHGRMLARTPHHDIIGSTFRDRDYFAGARQHLGKRGHAALHVSMVYRSRADGLFKFDLSAPVEDGHGRFLGVVAVSVTTGPDLGLPYVQDRRQNAVLFAPTEGSAGAPHYVVFMHPDYGPRARAFELAREVLPGSFPRRCIDEFSEAALRDAVSRRLDYGKGNAFSGVWLAGVAPIGRTGFVVAIQSEDLWPSAL